LRAAKRVRIGKIGAAHGVRGEVRMFVDADDPLAVKKLGALEDETGAREFRIKALRAAKDHLIVRFDGVNDRTAAEGLRHLELYVPRDRLPEQKDKNTFYQADLVGLRVEAMDGRKLGAIAAIQNFGAGDILEIAPLNGGDTFMIPFLDSFVPAVDIEGGRIVVDLPEETMESREARKAGSEGRRR
jgi:16S rRNA processing protein RimM